MATAPERLETNGASEPLGIATGSPRFSWAYPGAERLSQTAYRVVVGTNKHEIAERTATIWDSGWQDGHAQAITYDGKELTTRTRYWWRVGVRIDGGEDVWAEPTWFETGPSEIQGEWISARSGRAAPFLQRTIHLESDVKAARLYIAAGGLYEALIDDQRVGEQVLDTAVTDYEERVLVETHDVTDQLSHGANELALVLGRGRYALTTENTWGWQHPPWHTERPHVLAELTVETHDGATRSIGTNEDWRVSESQTTFDSIYEGDVYDARREGSGAWSPAGRVNGPDGRLVAQELEPMRIIESKPPVAIEEPRDGVYVFDFGIVTAGWARLEVEGAAGTEVTLRYGERLDEDSTVNMEQAHVDGDFQTDRYILAGEGIETWEPRFSYKGFQYVEVHGLPEPPGVETLTARVIHSAVEDRPTSEFHASNELLTRISENSRRTFLNNFHGIPTDTPVYEKNGWTGDVLVGVEAACYHFSMDRFLGKWLDDIADAQLPDGEVPPIVPTSDWGYSHAPFGGGITSPNPAWDAAYVVVPWVLYRHTGDMRMLADHYYGMAACADYLSSYARDGILDEGLGDWLAPGHGEIRARPPEGTGVTGTAYYYRVVDLLARIADILGHDDDAEIYRDRRTSIASAFNDTFLDPDTGTYRTGETDEYRQTSNVLPLAFGLAPADHEAAVAERLAKNVMEEHDGHLDTGFHGTAYLLPVLSEAGYTDVAYTVATAEAYPSWGHWIAEHDATTMYEAWELESRSRDHYAFGSIDAWFYGYLAGIQPAAPGFATVQVEPHFPSALESVDATVETVRGSISTTWEREGSSIDVRVTVPGNTTARVALPTAGTETEERPTQGKKPTEGTTVGAGTHRFRVEE